MPEENFSEPEQHSDHSSDYDSASEAEIKTENGQLTVTQHGIKKHVKKDKSVVCPVCFNAEKSETIEHTYEG